jgi:hypothetical protein
LVVTVRRNENAPAALVWVLATTLKAAWPAVFSHSATVCAESDVPPLSVPLIFAWLPSFAGLGLTATLSADGQVEVAQQVEAGTPSQHPGVTVPVQHGTSVRAAITGPTGIGPQHPGAPASGQTIDGPLWALLPAVALDASTPSAARPVTPTARIPLSNRDTHTCIPEFVRRPHFASLPRGAGMRCCPGEHQPVRVPRR